MNKDLLKGLTKEQFQKATNCKDSEELLALAKAEGIELSEEQLEAVSGGLCEPEYVDQCAWCNSKRFIEVERKEKNGELYIKYRCEVCGYFWVTHPKA